MKTLSRLLVVTVILAINFPLFAEGGSENGFAPPVLVSSIGFKAVYQDGQVLCTWNRYLRADFQYYKVVRSDTNPNPVYPEDGAIHFADSAGTQRYADPAPRPGTYYYRLTIVTQKGERWVSPVIKVIVPFVASPAPSNKDFAP